MDQRFRRLSRAAVIDELQFGVCEFQDLREVLDVSAFEVGRIDVRVFGLELGGVVAVGQRVAERKIGVAEYRRRCAGGRCKHQSSEDRERGDGARKHARTDRQNRH
jgi:hypothetical protein